MFKVDIFNNIGRHCNLPGDKVVRCWKVRAYMSNCHYLVRNVKTGEFRSVLSRDMHNLY
jgi:hypothetical protein